MKDWKGNNINIGDTVKIYLYRYITSGAEMSLMTIGKNGVKEVGRQKIPEEYTWVLCHTYKIIGGTQMLFKEKTKPDEITEVPLCMFDFAGNLNSFCHAVCIEGVSDSREEFMLNHFNS